MTMQLLFSLFFLRFVSFSKANAEETFFEDLRTQLESLNKNDNFSFTDPLSCGVHPSYKLVLHCDDSEHLAKLSLSNLSLLSIPSSISLCSHSLSIVTINSAGLTSLGDGFVSLENLNYLSLRKNPSLKASTDLFKDMRQLTYLDVSNTLISGVKPSFIENASDFLCDDSCVFLTECSENDSCSCPIYDIEFCEQKGCYWCSVSATCLTVEECLPCDSYNPTNCPSGCAGECGECSSIEHSSDCVSPCSWCSSLNTCLLDEEKCLPCDSISPTNCPSGCAGKCGKCSSIVHSSDCVSPCSWCSSSNTCLSSTEECSTQSSDSESNSSMAIILICVLIPVFVLTIVIVVVIIVLRKRRMTVDKLDAVLATTNITLEDSDFQ